MPQNPETQIADNSENVSSQNLRTVAAIEGKANRERTPDDRIVDAMAATVGTVYFWAAHVVIIGVWLVLNSGRIFDITPWDPWPYAILLTVFSLESTIISCTVLMIQARMKNQQAQRSHLELQISLLQEREATKTLHLLSAICKKLGIPEVFDSELADLERVTDPHLLHDEIKEKIVKS